VQFMLVPEDGSMHTRLLAAGRIKARLPDNTHPAALEGAVDSAENVSFLRDAGQPEGR